VRNLMALGLCITLAFAFAHGGAGKDGKDAKDKGGHAMDEHTFVKPGDIKWGPAPPGLPAGAQTAVLTGDPGKAGSPYVIRAKLPDGYTVPPHWHPSDENVTVLKGMLIVGRGDKYDSKHETELPAGGYMRMPKEMKHYAKAKGETILQIHGTGPFDISYVNKSEDPRISKDKK